MNDESNGFPSFDSITASMDDNFFERKTLFLVYVSANSGSLRFGVNSIYNDGENLCIHIEQTNNPDAVTMDMAGWFITVAMDKSVVENCKNFDADLDNLS